GLSWGQMHGDERNSREGELARSAGKRPSGRVSQSSPPELWPWHSFLPGCSAGTPGTLPQVTAQAFRAAGTQTKLARLPSSMFRSRLDKQLRAVRTNAYINQ